MKEEKSIELRYDFYSDSNLTVEMCQKGDTDIAVIIGNLGQDFSICYCAGCTVFKISSRKKDCTTLETDGKKLAEFINEHLDFYRKIILHGNSWYALCFLNLTQWLDARAKFRTSIVSVSAPLKGTDMLYRLYHGVANDISADSEFIKNLNVKQICKEVHCVFVVSKFGLSLNPYDLILWIVDCLFKVNGDGIVSLDSQIPDGMHDTVFASHFTAMRRSCGFVEAIIDGNL